MFDLRKFYEVENNKVMNSYQNTILSIRDICEQTQNRNDKNEKNEYYRLFNNIGNFIIKIADFEKNLDYDYFYKKTFDELLKDNNELYEDLLLKNYENSYANPSYCVKVFGDNFGQLLSYFYCIYKRYIHYGFFHKIYLMEEYNRLFIDVFNYINNNDKIDYDELKRIITDIEKKDRSKEFTIYFKEMYDKNFRYYTDIIENSDLSDLRYLFRYGKYISNNEIKTAKFLLNYPEDKIKKMANQIVKAYINGFAIHKKDLSKKTTVSIREYNIGQELIIRNVIDGLRRYNLEAVITDVSTTKINRQYNYDHKFDSALYYDQVFADIFEKSHEIAVENNKDILSTNSGSVNFMNFGEEPFNPDSKKECLKFTDEQSNIIKNSQVRNAKIMNKYLPMSETSFTVVSFPSPEIGDNFEKIFEGILEVNMLDGDKYEIIQQKMINVLDNAEFVHIKGNGNNETDIKIKLQEIKNPNKETKFLNEGTDINIPAGEVFTSPQLKGTDGILHIDEIYLEDLKYINLKLHFKDGYITEYSCSNFIKDEDNKKYIEENLLFPHKTLPIGEFAIGTNTLAYVIAKKYNIMNILPILIIEKMGPHFAIGDTCFIYQEDNPFFNKLDNKEVIARENEKTAMRKENINEAYTYKHIDITLPYESIGFISAVNKNGERTDIIRGGRFVLEGTEELNEPFDRIL